MRQRRPHGWGTRGGGDVDGEKCGRATRLTGSLTWFTEIQERNIPTHNKRGYQQEKPQQRPRHQSGQPEAIFSVLTHASESNPALGYSGEIWSIPPMRQRRPHGWGAHGGDC